VTQRQLLKQIQRSEIKLPPIHSELTELRHVGPPLIKGAAKVYVWADALCELIYAGLRRDSVMQAAVLVGGVYAGPGETFVEVRGYADLERYEDTTDFARSINEDWTLLRNRLARREERVSIVGWACLRQGLESELARDLQIAHRSFFNLPHQLLLAIEPHTQELALYGFDEIGRLVQIGFQLVVRRTDS